jgi:hypothetical protein
MIGDGEIPESSLWQPACDPPKLRDAREVSPAGADRRIIEDFVGSDGENVMRSRTSSERACR